MNLVPPKEKGRLRPGAVDDYVAVTTRGAQLRGWALLVCLVAVLAFGAYVIAWRP